MDIALDYSQLNEMLITFTDIVVPYNSPGITIMGGLYVNTDSNSFFGTFEIFDGYVSNIGNFYFNKVNNA